MPELRVHKRKPPTEKTLDQTIEDSFPASDPPAIGRSDRPGSPKDSPKKVDTQVESEHKQTA